MKINIRAILVSAMIILLFSCKKETINSKITDADGNEYSTIEIGSQVWMVENLKTSHYNDGTEIPNVPDSAQWKNLSTGAFVYYNKDAANDATYGKLYNWYAVNTGKLAPSGWHIPTDAEWATLITYLGGETVAGDKMKATTLWIAFAGIVNTNSSGFTGLPGGLRNSFNSKFGGIGTYGYFWSSTEYNASIAWSFFLDYSSSSAVKDNGNKKDGYAVRCIRD